jgi:hypothetical protein
MADQIDFDRKVTLPDHVGTRELDQELVLLNFDTETYYGLDEIGARMIAVLQETSSIEAGVRRLLDEFDVDEAQLRADVASLLGGLVDGGLVVLEPA